MSHKDSMKLGFVGFIYSPPAELEGMIERVKWQTSKVHELGGSVFHLGGMPLLPDDASKLEDLKEHIESIGVELELGCPYIFSLLGDGAKEAREGLKKQFEKARLLGINIMRAGYGKLNLATSRYNKAYPKKDQMRFIIESLKETGKIFEDAGLHFALENHCDFTGKEFAEIFSSVNSSHVGCTLDTANGFTVFCDANDDIENLAEFAFTTHIKDMVIEDSDPALGMVPLAAWGCAVGNGHVDIPRALEILDEKSPFADGLHLIIEQSWMKYAGMAQADKGSYDKECVHKGMKYLKNLLGRA
ncbi:MAG: sugar phosphate isomerase/epimerase [Clostridiales bacterium]|jgi:sugar phosphate isomerase/epimerase|nr:sugar phosphate isomerase/epimerase [Clostridiales bacterium]